MDTVTLIATAAYAYAGRSLAKGDTFEASEKDANLLKKVGRAVDAPKARPRIIRTSAIEPESAEDAIDTPKPTRQYRRRDLEPEP